MCILSSCHLKGNKEYGEYCKKHRNNYLVNNGIIVFERFTSKESDYLKKDIINTIEHFNIMDKKDLKSKKKKEVFFLLALLFKNLKIDISRRNKAKKTRVETETNRNKQKQTETNRNKQK